MVANSPARRLAEAVLKRRADLDLTQLDVWQAGGPSNTTLTKIENAEIDSLARVTARRLDKGLQWAPGSARAVFEKGEEPAPAVEGLGLEDARWFAEQIAAADEETRRRIADILRERGAGA